jgi:hypothetical protein
MPDRPVVHARRTFLAGSLADLVTANRLRLTIPPSVRLRADHVID